jgi:hypothetical protein
MYATILGILWISIKVSQVRDKMEEWTYLLMKFTSKARVVRAIDFMITWFVGVIGEFASFNGLELRTLVRILLAAGGRRCISMPKLFSTAVTSNASLFHVRSILNRAVRLSDL